MKNDIIQRLEYALTLLKQSDDRSSLLVVGDELAYVIEEIKELLK